MTWRDGRNGARKRGDEGDRQRRRRDGQTDVARAGAKFLRKERQERLRRIKIQEGRKARKSHCDPPHIEPHRHDLG